MIRGWHLIVVAQLLAGLVVVASMYAEHHGGA